MLLETAETADALAGDIDAPKPRLVVDFNNVPQRLLPAKVNGKWTRIEVMRRTAHLAGKTVADLRTDVRTSDLVTPRLVAAFIAVDLLDYNMYAVGYMMERDHTSIINLRKRMNELFKRYAKQRMQKGDKTKLKLLLRACRAFELENALENCLRGKGVPSLAGLIPLPQPEPQPLAA